MRIANKISALISLLCLSTLLASHENNYQQHHYDSLLSIAERSNASPNQMIEAGKQALLFIPDDKAKLKARSHEIIAQGYVNKNQYLSALDHYKEALSFYMLLGDSTELAKVYNRRGLVYLRLLNYPEAIYNLLEALKIREELGDKTEIASSLNNIAIYYKAIKQIDTAIDYYQKSYKYSQEVNDTIGQSYTLNNLALIYMDQNKYDTALATFRKSLEIKRVSGDSLGMARTLMNIGTLNLENENYSSALQNFKQGAEIFQRNNDRYGLFFIHTAMADLYIRKNEPNKAYPFIQNAEQLVDFAENSNQLLRYLEILSNYYLASGDIDKSRETLSEYAAKTREVFADRVSTQVAELSVIYDNERREQEKKILETSLALERLKLSKIKYLHVSLVAFAIIVLSLFVLSLYFMRKYRHKSKELALLNAEIKHVNHHLETIVDNRTRDLTLALKKAKESDNLKSTFLANMSHEIRTPLNGILGFSKLLLDESLSSQTRKQYLSIINRRGRNLLQIINDIINISLLDTGQVEIKETPFNLNQLLYDLYSIFNSESYGKKKHGIDVKLSLALSDSRSNMVSDPNRIEQILTNLLDNAIKFTPSGEVELGYHLNEDDQVTFFVKDTGFGIPEERWDTIFSRFNKDDNLFLSNASGTGLGLPICKGLVELLNGRIWLESKVDQGSTFYFTIPFLPASSDSKTYMSRTSVSTQSLDFEGKKILVVEDDLISYQFIDALLYGTNAKLIHAKNGEDAIEICKLRDDIDLVVMDMRLPFLDGYEATAHIKKIRPNYKVIAQTANVMSDDKAKCLSVGCDDYIPKPIDPDEFLRLVAHYLKKPVLG